jgi:hypothetical protein
MFSEQGGEFKRLRDSQFREMNLALSTKEVNRRHFHYINLLELDLEGFAEQQAVADEETRYYRGEHPNQKPSRRPRRARVPVGRVG